MILQGSIRKESEMSIFTSPMKDYTIEMERTPVSIWFTENSFKYFCKFTFKNNLGIKVLELTTTEEDITRFLENVYTAIEFGMSSIPEHFNPNSSGLQMFSFMIDRDLAFLNSFTLTVLQYNPMNQVLIPRLKIDLPDDNFYEFLNLIYFSFLIDIDERLINSPDFLL